MCTGICKASVDVAAGQVGEVDGRDVRAAGQGRGRVEVQQLFDQQSNTAQGTVPIFQLDPVVVTKANIKEVFANDPERLALLEG